MIYAFNNYCFRLWHQLCVLGQDILLSKRLVSPRCIHKYMYSYMQCLESNSMMHRLDFTNVTPCIATTYRIGKPVVKVPTTTYKVHVQCTGGQHNSFHLPYMKVNPCICVNGQLSLSHHVNLWEIWLSYKNIRSGT